MVAAAGSNTGFPHPGDWAGAKAAAIRLNKSGGINGQQIKIVTCNDNSERNATTACGRKAVSDKAIAMLGPSEAWPQDLLKVLSDARTAFLGSGTVVNEQVGKNSFPLAGGAYTQLGGLAVFFRDKLKIKDVAIVGPQSDTVAAASKAIQKVIEGAGLNYKGIVTFPLTTQDFGPIVAQLKSTGAKGVIGVLGSVLTPSIIQAANQIGFKPAWASALAGHPPAIAQKYKEVLQGLYLGSSNPPSTANTKAMRQFRKDVAAAKAQGVSDTDKLDDSMLTAWLQVVALRQVAKKYVKGNVSAPKLLAALKRAKNVDLAGFGTWSPGGKGIPDAPQIKRGALFVSQIDGNGNYKLLTSKPIDVFKTAKLT
jgi:ABC-type branched-subunit amino acid transport system substrate-binding protein